MSSQRKGASAQKSKVSTKGNTRIIAVCNQKGGCGKTTTVINIAAGLAKLGNKILVVDLDAQGNATHGLGVDPNELDESVANPLMEPKQYTLADVIIESPIDNLHIAPASISLAEFESKVASEIGRENRLKKALTQVQGHYDFIIIDTPPSLGLLSINALNAANEVFITLQAHPFALDGLQMLLESVSMIKEELNPSLKLTGVIVTMFDIRTKISKEVYNAAKKIKEVAPVLFKTVIHQNVKVCEASKARKPVLQYAPSSVGALNYTSLCREIVSTQNKSATKNSRSFSEKSL